MTPPLPPENGPEPRPEQLQDLLRAAVEQVRQEPVPEPRLNRALARARRLRRQPPSSRFQRIQLIIALTTLAAVLLLSLMFLMHLALLPSSEVKGTPPPKKPKPTPKGDGSIEWLGSEWHQRRATMELLRPQPAAPARDTAARPC